MGESRGLRNLALYPIYVVCLNGFFWFPVFFLYFTDLVGLEDALLLEAIYYFAVVVFEVPSGWASDRVGRRFALRSAALLLTFAYVAFYSGTAFWGLAVAQILLAAGFAFNSGTDTAFHYDSLVATNREHEYGEREERIARLSFAAVGVTGLIGGFIGAVDLRLCYAAAAVMMSVGFVVTLGFSPPEQATDAPAERLDRQLVSCVRDLSDPVLAWLFGASVLLTVVIHVPYQLYQPYLALLELPLLSGAPVPVLTGAHAFVAMMAAALVASRSVQLARRIGLHLTVVSSLLFGVLLPAAMAFVLHPLVALLLVFRSGSRAVLQAPMNAAITPRIPRSRRASYLSMQSLAGRLAFSLLLFGLSIAVGDANDYSSLSMTATIASVVCGIAWLLVVATGRHARVSLHAGADST